MSRPTPTAPTGALAALVVALVAGILGMHAFTVHGTPPVEAYDAAPAVGAVTMSGEHVHAAADTTAATTPTTTTPTTTRGHHGQGEHAEHLLMLCAVMLGGAALVLLGLLITRGRHLLRLPRTLEPAQVVATLVAHVRATGPPPAWEFSVIRC